MRPAAGWCAAAAALALAGPFVAAPPAGAQAPLSIVSVRYVDPTMRYTHGVLGDAVEHDTLEATLSDGRRTGVRWAGDMVFEDTAPRLADVDGDGAPEVVAVESDARQGARLAIYGLSDDGTLALMVATPFIGTRHRWLAPVGAADLDGDGAVEIAYVDRPHLDRVLRIWRMEASPGARPGRGTYALVPVARMPGVTNHRIGDATILGGIRACPGRRPEMIVATPDWSRMVAVTMKDGILTARDAGPGGARRAKAVMADC